MYLFTTNRADTGDGAPRPSPLAPRNLLNRATNDLTPHEINPKDRHIAVLLFGFLLACYIFTFTGVSLTFSLESATIRWQTTCLPAPLLLRYNDTPLGANRHPITIAIRT